MSDKTKPHCVAYQGIDGAYSQEAIFRHLGTEVPTHGCPSFEEVIARVESGAAEIGFLPAENSVAGTIVQTYDLLLESKLRIVGEYYLPIHHHLMILPDADPKGIEVVYSHPQGLAQCAQFIKRAGYRAEVEWDTAGSALKIRQEALRHAAAIASKQAAAAYELRIIAANIEDVAHNTTRFFILGKTNPQPAQQNKTSILFSSRHEPGALVNCLHEFSSRGINLTKIESRPDRQHPWHYIFYVDFEGHTDDAAVEQAILHLLKQTHFVKILGSYPMGNHHE